jgi:hypothetical protein
MLYLQKRDGEHPFWDFARRRPGGVPPALAFLAWRGDRLPVGDDELGLTLDYLWGLGFRDDEAYDLQTPVLVVDAIGDPVEIDGRPLLA